jgi:hypothetical protein
LDKNTTIIKRLVLIGKKLKTNEIAIKIKIMQKSSKIK